MGVLPPQGQLGGVPSSGSDGVSSLLRASWGVFPPQSQMKGPSSSGSDEAFFHLRISWEGLPSQDSLAPHEEGTLAERRSLNPSPPSTLALNMAHTPIIKYPWKRSPPSLWVPGHLSCCPRAWLPSRLLPPDCSGDRPLPMSGLWSDPRGLCVAGMRPRVSSRECI